MHYTLQDDKKTSIMSDKDKYSENCPIHNIKGKFIPPTKIDKKNRKVIVTFECKENHIFQKEFDLR